MNPLWLAAARLLIPQARQIVREFGHDSLEAFAAWLGYSGDDAVPRAAVAAVGPAAGGCGWGTPQLNVYRDLAPLGVSWANDAYDSGLAMLAKVCGVQFTIVADRSNAHIWAMARPIDGNANVLAWSEMPCPAPPVPPGLEQRYDRGDSAVVAAPARLSRIVAHEVGHALGLPHNNNPASLLYPYINSDSGEIADSDPIVPILRQLYGPPVARPDQPPTPGPVPIPPPVPAPAPPTGPVLVPDRVIAMGNRLPFIDGEGRPVPGWTLEQALIVRKS